MNNFIANKLKTMSCPHCGKRANVTVTATGIDISTCCDKFRKILLKEVETQKNIYAERQIKKGFKKL